MKKKSKLGEIMARWGIIIAVVIAFILFSILAPKAFFNVSNFATILQSISITTVIALGATVGFATGLFDISFATLATLGAAFGATFIAWFGLPAPLAVILAILCCMLVGVVNTIVVVKFNVNSFLATLAMQFILGGIVLTYSGGSIINPRTASASGRQIVAEIPQWFTNIGKSPYIIIIMFVCVAVVEFFLNQTKHGRIMYTVGANQQAAKLTGINVGKYILMAFLITDVFSCIAGFMIVGQAGTVQSTAGDGFLMPAIAAANIGYSFAGRGKANALGTFFGAALIGIVENGLYAMAFPYYSINIVKGVILLIALVMSGLSTKKVD